MTARPLSRAISNFLLAAVCLLPSLARAEIIDRIAAVVGRQVVTESDVQREARLEAYFDGQPPPGALTPQTPQYRQVLERLIRQQLIQYEMDQTRFPSVDAAQAKKQLQAMNPVQGKPGDYNLKEQDLIDYARRLANVARFLELRFGTLDAGSKPSAIPEEQLETYYRDVFLPSLARKENSSVPSLNDVRGEIEQTLRRETEIDAWLKELRSRVGVRIMEPGKP